MYNFEREKGIPMFTINSNKSKFGIKFLSFQINCKIKYRTRRKNLISK